MLIDKLPGSPLPMPVDLRWRGWPSPPRRPRSQEPAMGWACRP